jgi:arylsulfatase A-like enzyme
MHLMKIVVIEAIGLHLGYLGCYGNDWVATPNLDRLAAEGVVFDWHIADQPELQATTRWAKRSVGTGCYAQPGAPVTASANVPRIVRCAKLSQFADRALAAIGANDAWLWLEGPSLLPPWRLEDEMLEAYFDEGDIEDGLAPWRDPPLDLVALNDAEVVQLQNTYAAAVTSFDAQLGKLIEDVGARDDLLLCVTARSGLPLSEHGMIGAPEPRLHDELVHVPLVLRLPGGAEAGMRVAALTQPVDLAPTFLEALGHAPLPVHGHSLWPLIRGEVEAVRPYAVSMLHVGDRESWLMRTLDRALHLSIGTQEDVAPQIFVKPDDRWEVNNLHQQQTESAEAMEKALRAFAAAIERVGPLEYPPVEFAAG